MKRGGEDTIHYTIHWGHIELSVHSSSRASFILCTMVIISATVKLDYAIIVRLATANCQLISKS